MLTTKTVHVILVRYAKLWSHLFIIYQAIGEATRTPIVTSFKKSLDSSATMLVTLAPNTFRYTDLFGPLFRI